MEKTSTATKQRQEKTSTRKNINKTKHQQGQSTRQHIDKDKTSTVQNIKVLIHNTH